MVYEKKAGHVKWVRVLLGMFAVIVAIVGVTILFISPIAKYVVEKYDEKFLGRQIKMDWIYVNPFTGYVHASNVRVYELNSDTIFFMTKGLSANFSMSKLFRKTYEIENVTLTKPWGCIIQNGKALNFDDIIQRFTPKDTTHKSKNPLHFNILDITINDGEFHYEERSIPISYYVKDVNIKSTGKRWDVDSMPMRFAFNSGPSTGEAKGELTIDFSTLEYWGNAQMKKFSLNFLGQYLKALTNFGVFTANLDADIKASGNLGKKLAITTSGLMAINDFHFGKAPGKDYASFDKLAIDMVKADPRNFSYYLDSVMLNKLMFRYERYDYLDNIQRMFGEGGANIKAANADATKFNLVIEIAKFVNDLTKNFMQSYFKINKVRINDANLMFNDFSPREKFSVAAHPLYISADSIDKNNDRFKVSLHTNLQPFGSLAVNLSMDPTSYGYFNLEYNLQKIPLPLFNPYVITYTSYPLDRGTLEFNGYMNVDASLIKSHNHLLIIDPRTSKRIQKSDTKWIPLPLILSIIRQRSAVVDYDIPVFGYLKNPKFNLWKAVIQIAENIVVKPPSTAYLMHVRQTENEVEKYLTLKWEMRQTGLRPVQEKFVEKIAGFLKKNPDANITIAPFVYSIKEKEYIMLFEAKKKYLLQTKRITGPLTEDDSLKVEKMSVKDSFFVQYLDKAIHDSLVFTVQEKCDSFIGESIIYEKFWQLIKSRESAFMSYFKKYGVEGQVKILAEEVSVPYGGFSYYKIDYRGAIPDNLRKAYDEMDELNTEAPRKKYEQERRKSGL